jgi:CMP-N,N'-diacetyllegionaminic acid synthase
LNGWLGKSRMKVLFLITARGGSKGVPGKNIRMIGGIPLLGYKALSARKSKSCSRLILSTDSPEIQEIGRRYGAEVPFTRPAELATDTAKSTDVILHAMTWIEQEGRERYDAVMLLEPSAPFARPEDYDRAVEIMRDRQANAVLGMREVEPNSVFVGPLGERGNMSAIIDKMHEHHKARRQDLPQEYTMNGALYLFRWDFFKQHRNIYHDREATYGHVMELEYSIEIDSMINLRWAEFLVENKYVDINCWKS